MYDRYKGVNIQNRGVVGVKKMDYNLGALKLLSSHLTNAKETTTQQSLPAFSLFGILFQRAWLQGIVVSTPSTNPSGKFLIDDGTGIIELVLIGDSLNTPWEIGMYIMVVGGYFARKGDLPLIKVHKMVDLSQFPDREAMWYLEVIEAFTLFYLPLYEE